MTPALLNGLVLAGGESRRMGRDKAALEVGGRSALARALELIGGFCAQSFVSVRPGDSDGLRARFQRIEDSFGGVGPADGIASAQAHDPDAAWLVLACDLPRLDRHTVARLVSERDARRDATAFRSTRDSTLPEPLCAIYEPASRARIAAFLGDGIRCPRKMLLSLDTLLLEPASGGALDNMNTPDDWARFQGSPEAR